MTRRDVHAKPGERGFALLLVMLLAAAIAFGLYTQLPRFAFESMRGKEQLLLDRGNQYKRAIQVYYAVNKHYPARIEDLENTNDKRFLRRRYKDPMTGSDEWRLIHTNGTTLTDSLVQKPAAQNGANGTPGAGILPGGGPLGTNNMNSSAGQPNAQDTSNNGAPQPAPVNPASLRRPSDRLTPGSTTPAPVASQDPNFIPGLYPANYNPNDPSTWPAITLAPPNPQTGAPGQPGQTGQPGFSGQPGQPGQIGQPNQPVSIPGFGGQSPVPGQQPIAQITADPFGQQAQGVVQPTPLPFGQQPNPGDGSTGVQPLQYPYAAPAQTPSGIPGQGLGQGGANPQPAQVGNAGFGPYNPFAQNPGQQSVGFPAATTGNQAAQGNPAGPINPQAQLNPAVQAINNQLASPGGPPAVPGPANSQNPQAGPGIAGVASKFEGASIKVYNKRSKYKEWEFVYDPSTGTTTGQPASGQNPLGQPGQGQTAGQPGGSGGSFSLSPNPFTPTTGQTSNQSGQTPNSTAPGTNPFGQTQTSNPFGATQSTSPFGQSQNPFGTSTQ
jgi:hypothetical protein